MMDFLMCMICALNEKIMSDIKIGRVVMVTGASAGVGRAIVRAFAAEKAKIGLIARGRDGLEAAKKEVESLGGQALVLPLDVSDYKALEEALKKVEDAFGSIDIWVNDAMVSVFSPVKEMQPDEYKRVTEVTYLGYVYGTMVAMKSMLPRDKGIIIQIGSALAYRSIPLQSAYCGAKHAIYGFTESLRTELLHDKSRIRVVMMELPAVNTPQFSWVKSRLPNKPQPVPPIFQPEVIARAVIHASHHPRREYKIAWPAIKASLGEKFAANYADHYLAAHGYSGQQTGTPVNPDRQDNLWRPVEGDHGARGTFNKRAANFSPVFWFSKNRFRLACTFLAVAVLGAIIFLKK
jgi:NADP-dependent 3-hydroxy acid dehydrogenase YdfG